MLVCGSLLTRPVLSLFLQPTSVIGVTVCLLACLSYSLLLTLSLSLSLPPPLSVCLLSLLSLSRPLCLSLAVCGLSVVPSGTD